MYPSSDDEYSRRHDEALADFDQWIAQPTPQELEMARLAEFHTHLLARTPLVFAARTIVAVNVAVFAVMVLSGVGFVAPKALDLIEWGANFGPKTLSGQWWRLFTSMFLHIGVIHLAVNMWALWAVGQMVERLVGNAGFVVLYLVSGLAGSMASVYWNPSVVSAGASGAIFGVFGAILGFLLPHRDAIPPLIFREIRQSTLACLGYNLAFSMMVPGIDMACHLGGLVAGFACALIMSQPLAQATWPRRLIRNLAAALAGSLGLAAALQFSPPPPGDVVGEVHRFLATERQSLDAYNQAVKKRQEGQLNDQGFADVIQRDILPKWQEGRQRLEALRDVPKRQEAEVARIVRYARLREEAWTLTAEALRDRDPEKARAAEQKSREVEAFLREEQTKRDR